MPPPPSPANAAPAVPAAKADAAPAAPMALVAPAVSALPQSVKQCMMLMDRSMKGLKSQITDAAKKDGNLKLIADMQRGCLAAKALAPAKAIGREPDDAKKAEMATMYRKDMILMMAKLLAVESAVLDGKGAEAEKLLGEIGDLRDQGHSEFNVKD